MTTNPSLKADPDASDIDAILHFLPEVDSPEFTPGAWTPAEADALPHFSMSSSLEAFVMALYEHHWIYDFDWPAWLPVAERYVQSPKLLDDIGVGTVRKLFTTHVRRDRFAEGHLAAIAAQGHLKALLHRLKTLREAIPQ